MVEIIPKPPEKIPFWQNLIIFLLIAILIIVVFSYFGLGYLQKKANQEIKSLDEKIANTETQEKKDLKNHILTEKKRIDDFAFLLKEHQKSSNFLLFLEKTTHPKVQFTDFKLDTLQDAITLNGRADSFVSLGQQLIIFQQANQTAKEILGQEISKVDLAKISIGEEGKINFTFNLSFSPPRF